MKIGLVKGNANIFKKYNHKYGVLFLTEIQDNNLWENKNSFNLYKGGLWL